MDDLQVLCAAKKKIVWEIAPYLRGHGLDLGPGAVAFKALPHVTSVNDCSIEVMGQVLRPDVTAPSLADLSIFASQSMDFIVVSYVVHTLDDPDAALKEYRRVLKIGGTLVIHSPSDKAFYYTSAQNDYDVLQDNYPIDGENVVALRRIKGSSGRSIPTPITASTALVCRFGAYGDLLQASSIFSGLKAQGYHVTLMASQPGVDVVSNDPNIDSFILLDRDQIPNGDLGEFWAYYGKKFDKFINLSESVEGTWLALPSRTQSCWSPLVRHKYMDGNYLQFQHELAGVPHKPAVQFFPTPNELAWGLAQRARMGRKVVLWALAGSSVHKTWAGLDGVIAAIMTHLKDTDVVLCGGAESVILEAGWENEPRVHRTSGKWSMRQTLTFLRFADLVIGPETGVLNAASCMSMPKIVFLSHSSIENLTRDWVNTTSLYGHGTRCALRDSDDVTACHTLHYGWGHCTKDAETGTAQCQKDIPESDVWAALIGYLAEQEAV